MPQKTQARTETPAQRRRSDTVITERYSPTSTVEQSVPVAGVRVEVIIDAQHRPTGVWLGGQLQQFTRAQTLTVGTFTGGTVWLAVTQDGRRVLLAEDLQTETWWLPIGAQRERWQAAVEGVQQNA